MHRMHRPLGILTIVTLSIATAACALGTGSSGSSDPSIGSAASMNAEAGAATGGTDGERVSIDDLLADPSLYADRQITVSENVEEVFAGRRAFLFTGTEIEGQLLVVVTPDAPIQKEIAAGRVVTVTGMVVPLTEEDLDAAGIPLDDEIIAAVQGNAVLVATAISDPLAGG